MNARAVDAILRARHDPGAARRRHPRHEDRRGLARARASRASSSARRRCAIRTSCARRRVAIRARSRSASTPRTGASPSRAGRRPRRMTAEELGRRFEDAGVAAIIYTDIARDGVLKGLNIPMTLAPRPCGLDPGDRLGRPRLDGRYRAPARARLRQACRRDHRPRALRRADRPGGGAGADRAVPASRGKVTRRFEMPLANRRQPARSRRAPRALPRQRYCTLDPAIKAVSAASRDPPRRDDRDST